MRAIDVEAFIAAVRRGATVLDTRPRALYARDAVPGAVSISLEHARRGLVPALRRDAEIVVVCEWGRMSELAGLYLEAHGFTRVFHLTGGMAALRKAAATDAKPGTERH